MRAAKSPYRLLAVILLVAPSFGQVCSLTAPESDSQRLQPLWGGETRHLHAWHRAAGQGGHHPYRLWTAEDGGRIRYSGFGGASGWNYQATPEDVGGTLLDVWFLEDGMTGWACGRGGVILETSDAGWSGWTHASNTTTVHLDDSGDPATIWRTRWFDDRFGIAAGVKFLQVTADGGETWRPLEIYEDAAFTRPIPLSEMRFYALDVKGHPFSPDGWVGAVAARRVHDDGEPDPLEEGVVLHTNSQLPGTSFGRKWWVTLNDRLTPADALWPPSGPGDMREPWDLVYERGSPATPSLTHGYVAGGRGQGQPGRIFKTEDGGFSWTEEGADPTGLEDETGDAFIPTVYGISALADGFAVIGAYAGQVWVKEPGDLLWSFRLQETGRDDWYSAPIADAEAVYNPTEDRNEGFVVGSFGFQRASRDQGTTWESVHPSYQDQGEQEWRLRGLGVVDGQTAFATAQFAVIARTTDGGCTWDLRHGGLGNAPGSYLFDVDFDELGQSGVAVGNHGEGVGLMFSADAGDNWRPPVVEPLGGSTWELKDVDHRGGLEFWAVGQDTASKDALFVRTLDGGMSWEALAVPPLDNLLLEAIALVPGTDDALVVGRSGHGANRRPRSYKFTVSHGVNTWKALAVPDAPGVADELYDVDLRGTSLADAEAFAVGSAGMLLSWDVTTQAWGSTPGVYAIDGSTPPLLATDLATVTLAPAPGSEVLALPFYPTEVDAPAADVGFYLRRRDGSWDTERMLFGYTCEDAELVADGLGFVVGSSVGVATVEGGSVADAGLARYDDPPSP